MSYEKKYLKYKNKYLKLKGGMFSENSSSSASCVLSLDEPIRDYFRREYSNRAAVGTKDKNNKILSTFHEPGWNILPPRGDGKCLIYAIMHALEISTHNRSIEDYILQGFKEYFDVEHQEGISLFNGKYFKSIDFLASDSDAELNRKINRLLDDNNLDLELSKILKYAFNTSILIL